jgi:hypothetical protein
MPDLKLVDLSGGRIRQRAWFHSIRDYATRVGDPVTLFQDGKRGLR